MSIGDAGNVFACENRDLRDAFLSAGNGQSPEGGSLENGGLHGFSQREGLLQIGLTLFQKQGGTIPQNRLDSCLCPQRYGNGCKGTFRDDLLQRIGGKSVGEQRFGIFKALCAGGVLHNDRERFDAVPLRRAGETVECVVGGAGFQAGGPFVETDQLVGVDQF